MCSVLCITSHMTYYYISSELVVLIDVELPGMITEFHDTGGNG